LNLPPSAPVEVMNDRSRWAQARESRAYCHEVQNGPYDLIDTAWRHAMDPIIKEIIDAVPMRIAAVRAWPALPWIDMDRQIQQRVTPSAELSPSSSHMLRFSH